jgi:hypothetical protein
MDRTAWASWSLRTPEKEILRAAKRPARILRREKTKRTG